MAKLLYILPTILLLVPITVYAQEYLTYDNTFLGFSMQYPAGLQLIDQTKNSELDILHGPIAIILPVETGEREASMLMFVEDLLDRNMTIKEYTREQLNDDYRIFDISNYQEVNNNQTVIDNKPAWQIENTIDTLNITAKEKSKRQSLSVYVIANDKAYDIGYSADQGEQYAKYLPEVQRLINSIKFTEP